MPKLILLFLLFLLPALAKADCTPAFRRYQFLNPDLLDYDSRLGPFYLAFPRRYGAPETRAREARTRHTLTQPPDSTPATSRTFV